MPSERKRRADIVRTIVITRERFPHTPRLTAALRRMMWRYMTEPVLPTPPPAPAKTRKNKQRR